MDNFFNFRLNSGSMQLKRVVVTGLGALTPIGNTLEAYWDGLKNGVSGAAPITYFDTEKFKTKFACELKGYDPQDHFDRKEARKLDRFAQYALVSSDEAIADAGLDLEKVDKFRVGVVWGAGIGGLETFQNEVIGYAQGDGTPRFNPFFTHSWNFNGKTRSLSKGRRYIDDAAVLFNHNLPGNG